MKRGYVYMLASSRNGTLYVGVTADLCRRIEEHKNKVNNGFTKKYNIHRLVYFEEHESIWEAIVREKQLKFWRRTWKIAAIEKENPKWNDLYEGVCLKEW